MIGIQIQSISAEETYELRHKILRPNQKIEDCKYPGDADESTFHVGAFLGTKLVGIASVFRENLDSEEYSKFSGFRLRGMAVEFKLQATGVGSKLLKACIEEAKTRNNGGKAIIWANARTSAMGFYERLDMKPTGDEFEIENIGPHFVMFLPL